MKIYVVNFTTSNFICLRKQIKLTFATFLCDTIYVYDIFIWIETVCVTYFATLTIHGLIKSSLFKKHNLIMFIMYYVLS